MKYLACARIVVGGLLAAPLYVSPTFAAEKLCCACTSNGPSVVRESNNLNTCRNACAAGEKPTDDFGWTIDAGKQCFREPLPPALTPQSLVDSIVYLVGHQAAVVWENTPTDKFLTGKSLRNELTSKDGLKRLVQLSSDAEVEAATKAAVGKCVAQFSQNITAEFAGVCSAHRLHDQMTSTLTNNRYDLVRELFGKEMRDDARIRYVLYCYSNSELRNLIQNDCPAANPPPQNNNVDRATGQPKRKPGLIAFSPNQALQVARSPTDPIAFDSHGGGPHRVHIVSGAVGDVVFAFTDTSHDQPYKLFACINKSLPERKYRLKSGLMVVFAKTGCDYKKASLPIRGAEVGNGWEFDVDALNDNSYGMKVRVDY